MSEKCPDCGGDAVPVTYVCPNALSTTGSSVQGCRSRVSVETFAAHDHASVFNGAFPHCPGCKLGDEHHG